MNVEKHIEKLGMRVKDKVTGFSGVVSSVSFDLYGCIQAVVTPPKEKAAPLAEGRWFDIARLEVVSKTRVMPIPDFNVGDVAEGKKGPAEKPPM
jgi:hypothetical protein